VTSCFFNKICEHISTRVRVHGVYVGFKAGDFRQALRRCIYPVFSGFLAVVQVTPLDAGYPGWQV